MIESELRLMLLRHWTLYDSCKHSNYVVSKLELWKEPGIKRFHHFLAKVGVPLEQAKQKYQYMDPDLKKELKSRILDNSFESSLDKIIMSSYVRQVTEDTQISATDMVYSITSLLEQPAPLEGLESSKKNKNNISSISKDAKDSINLMKNSVAAKKLEEHV
jgi:cell division control protein 45